MNLNMQELVDELGNWKLDTISGLFPDDVINRIHSLLPPNRGTEEDKRMWPSNSLGEFTISSAYTLLAQTSNPPDVNLWKIIWELHVPVRICTFIWMVAHERILTNKRKARMGLGNKYGVCLLNPVCDPISLVVIFLIGLILILVETLLGPMN